MSWNFVRFLGIQFQLNLKVSAFYLEKQKSFIPKKYDLDHFQYQNKKALFADPIFSEDVVLSLLLNFVCYYTLDSQIKDFQLRNKQEKGQT